MFLIDHEASLRQHLGAPVRSVALPPYLQLLDNVVQHPSGVFTATAKTAAVWEDALTILQISTGSEFSKQRSHSNPPAKHPQAAAAVAFTVRTDYGCRFAGLAPSECLRRGELPENARLASGKSEKCGCTAKISVWVELAPGQPLRVELDLTHTGHVPGSDNDKTSLPMHARCVLLE